MNHPLKAMSAFAAIALLVACSEDRQTADSASVVAEDIPVELSQSANTGSDAGIATAVTLAAADTADEAFSPDYIHALNLFKRFESNTVPFIFDVRSPVSYQQSHIKESVSMPYGTFDEDALGAVEGLDGNSEIVTYCGCPRHLSSLAAEQLTGMGYGNVKVLFEGYWHWRDNDFPVVQSAEQTAITRLNFDGVMSDQQRPLANTDVFLRHRNSGQLEAVRTDERGRFKVEFHLYDYRAGDRFDIVPVALDMPARASVSAADFQSGALQIEL